MDVCVCVYSVYYIQPASRVNTFTLRQQSPHNRHCHRLSSRHCHPPFHRIALYHAISEPDSTRPLLLDCLKQIADSLKIAPTHTHARTHMFTCSLVQGQQQVISFLVISPMPEIQMFGVTGYQRRPHRQSLATTRGPNHGRSCGDPARR